MITIRISEAFPPFIYESDATFILTVKSTIGISDHYKKDFNCNIYPNPTISQITITSPSIIDKIEIMDVMGRVVYYGKPNEKSFKVRMEKEGIYFVRLSTEQRMITRKVVVE